MQSNILSRIGAIGLNALLSAGIILQLDKSNRKLSLGLLVIWLGMMFTRALIASRHKQNAQPETLLYGTALGLTLIQAKTITHQNDEHGITQFLIISAGLLAGASLNRKEAKSLLQWLGFSGLAISILILMPMLQAQNFSAEALVNGYETVFKNGFGDQSSLRMTLTLLISANVATARLSENLATRIAFMGASSINYLAIFATSSRMAMAAPIISLILAFLIDKWATFRKKGKRYLIITCATGLLGCFLATWKLVISPDLAGGMTSDSVRISIWGCWLRSIFSGNNRFLIGFGHDSTPISNICTDIAIGVPTTNPVSASTHAHNSIINVTSHYGILGLTSLIILAYIYIRPLINQPDSESQAKHSFPIWACSWKEASLITGLAILICALSNTLHIKNQALSLLTGILLSLPFCEPSPPKDSNPGKQNAKLQLKEKT